MQDVYGETKSMGTEVLKPGRTPLRKTHGGRRK
jgi:hypothetical protein